MEANSEGYVCTLALATDSTHRLSPRAIKGGCAVGACGHHSQQPAGCGRKPAGYRASNGGCAVENCGHDSRKPAGFGAPEATGAWPLGQAKDQNRGARQTGSRTPTWLNYLAPSLPPCRGGLARDTVVLVWRARSQQTVCVSLYTWRQTQKESQRSPSPENLRLLRILEQESKAVEILREDLQKCDHGSEQVNRLHIRVGWGQGVLAKLGSLAKFLDRNTESFTFDGKDVALTSPSQVDWAENPDGSIYRRQTMGGIYRRPSPAVLLQHQQEAARLREGPSTEPASTEPTRGRPPAARPKVPSRQVPGWQRSPSRPVPASGSAHLLDKTIPAPLSPCRGGLARNMIVLFFGGPACAVCAIMAL